MNCAPSCRIAGNMRLVSDANEWSLRVLRAVLEVQTDENERRTVMINQRLPDTGSTNGPTDGPSDPFDLERFVTAQAGDWESARAELRAGRKTTHWIWYIFPQMRGLGRSPTAKRFSISSLDEAKAYLAHPFLGPRLIEATKLTLAIEGRALHEIFGSPDDMKFRSSMTLFAEAGEGGIFAEAIDRLCGGERDDATLKLLGRG